MTSRSHRGPDPEDARQLGEAAWPALRSAVADLSWLLGRGYADVAALKVVGDRYQLTRRQRTAVRRCTCTDAARSSRLARRVEDLAGQDVHVDGFNTLITTERGLAGGPVFVGRDGACRDLASVHGTWRAVSETPAAIVALARTLAPARSVRWLLDAPVSNSGRLAAMLRDADPRWEVEVVARPDPLLAASHGIVITSDSWILDQGVAWADAVGDTLARERPDVWWVDLRDSR